MKKEGILRNKFYLYITEFFAGMSVMAVELGASRLLAPYFSSSQIVWTIIIGTIMIAMALGNIYGGRAADKNPNPDKLYGRMIAAAIWIAAIPVLGKYIILGISAVMIFSVNSNFLVWAAFAACMVIFVFPLFLLGTVTPSLVKYTVDSLDDSGATVGKLNAFNTIGSILGTFLPTFVTIPTVGTSVTFFIFAGILLLLSVFYFLSKRAGLVKSAVSAILFILCFFLGRSDSFAFWEDSLTYEGESVYNYLQVSETPESVILSTNVLFGVQSIYKKKGSLTGMYYDYALAAPYMTGIEPDDTMNILILGMGTGTYASQCRRFLDKPVITGVEIDGDITKLAHEFFHLSEEIPVYTYDGRAFLNVSDEVYDVIMVDAYQDITIPFQMSSVEFFRLVKEHLSENGVMVVNMNMRGRGEGTINQYLSDTIAQVFSNVYTVEVKGSTNRELFATNISSPMENLEERIALEENPDLTALMNGVKNTMTRYEAGNYLLTDDKAPVELLGIKVIDSLIADEVVYYKKVYDEGGIQALIDSFR